MTDAAPSGSAVGWPTIEAGRAEIRRSLRIASLTGAHPPDFVLGTSARAVARAIGAIHPRTWVAGIVLIGSGIALAVALGLDALTGEGPALAQVAIAGASAAACGLGLIIVRRPRTEDSHGGALSEHLRLASFGIDGIVIHGFDSRGGRATATLPLDADLRLSTDRAGITIHAPGLGGPLAFDEAWDPISDEAIAPADIDLRLAILREQHRRQIAGRFVDHG